MAPKHSRYAEYCTKERDARLVKLWSQIDQDNKGSVDLEEFKEGMQRLHHPLRNADRLINELFEHIDATNEKRVHFDEFKQFYEATDRALWRAFVTVDTDSNGKIDHHELTMALHSHGMPVSFDVSKRFFEMMDKDKDGHVSFEEWRDYLFFMPPDDSSIVNFQRIYSYYLSTVNVNPEGDVDLSFEINLKGIGYFLSGGLAGVVSRTATAPLDRVKVYLIAQTQKKNTANAVVGAVKDLKPVTATKTAARPIREAVRTLWNSGGIRAFFAGNGLNVVKVFPESAIKFGSFEAAKRFLIRLEGKTDTRDISPVSRFLAGGIGGVMSQAAIYPIDTLKFRVQCESVAGGARGNALIQQTVLKMWRQNGFNAFFRGLPLGLVGIFPYSAIDLGSFEYMKRLYTKSQAKALDCTEDDIDLPNLLVLAMGATSGTVGAAAVYPMNVIRTRMQAQGTAQHPQTYDGVFDAIRKTYTIDGVRGFYRGLTPNLLKVIPAVSISYLVYENTKQLMRLK